MRKLLTSLLCVVLSTITISCGGGGPPKDLATVRSYTDVNGVPTPHADSLGFTFWGEADAAEFGTDGYNCLINEMMVGDADPDRMVRVIVHELESAQVLRAGDFPATMAGDWYVWSAENVPPFSAPVPAEGAWLATLPSMRVVVDGRDASWLALPVALAVERLNDAAGRSVFVLSP